LAQKQVLPNNFIAIDAGYHHNLALVPKPSTLLLLGLGMAMLRRKRWFAVY
jgi:hypothetical protein